MTKTLEPFLREPDEETFGENQKNSKCRTKGNNLALWGGQQVHKYLKLQVVSSLCILWLGVIIYGCRFPVPVVLNQVLISMYFIILYAFGIVIGYYIKSNVSLAGVRVALFLQLVTVFGSICFEYLALLSMRQHRENDMNPLTRIWASFLYSLVILANSTVVMTSLLLTCIGFRICCDCFGRRRKSGAGSDSQSDPVENAEV